MIPHVGRRGEQAPAGITRPNALGIRIKLTQLSWIKLRVQIEFRQLCECELRLASCIHNARHAYMTILQAVKSSRPQRTAAKIRDLEGEGNRYLVIDR